MTVSKADYDNSRKEINRVIENASESVGNHLENLVLARAKSIYCLIREWYDYYSKDDIVIKDFKKDLKLPDNIGETLSKLYTEYFEHTITYRILHGNTKNIIFAKIISFELHFFKKHNVFTFTKINAQEKPSDSDLTGDEKLFRSDPLGHFFYYRIQKEYHLSKKSNNPVQARKLYDDLLKLLLEKLMEFFKSIKNNVGLYDLIEFADKPEQKHFKKVLDRITNRNFWD